jgi:hypothetical protein
MSVLGGCQILTLEAPLIAEKAQCIYILQWLYVMQRRCPLSFCKTFLSLPHESKNNPCYAQYPNKTFWFIYVLVDIFSWKKRTIRILLNTVHKGFIFKTSPHMLYLNDKNFCFVCSYVNFLVLNWNMTMIFSYRLLQETHSSKNIFKKN